MALQGTYFDASYYIDRYSDLSAWVGSPFNHYVLHGAAEDRTPNAWFNWQNYRSANADLQSMDALQLFEHYENYGYKEGRAPSSSYANFDEAAYLDTYRDLGTAGITAATALNHYLVYGASENRTAKNDDGTLITGGSSSATGTTYTLTTALDNIPGTTKDDLFVGDDNTLNSGDVLNGASGSDTLQFTDGVGVTRIPNLSGIETLKVTAASGTTTLNLVNSSDITTIKSVGSSANLAVSNIAAIAALDLGSVSAGTTTLTYSAATVAGTADTQAIALSSNGTSTTDIGAVTVGGMETISVTATGANYLTSLVDASMTTLNIAGAGSLRVTTALAAAVTTINAADNTGGVTLGSAGGVITFTGGTGNDTINMGATLTTGDTLNGGDGTDTLRVATAADVPTGAMAKITNFEGFTVDAIGAGVTLDVDNLGGAITQFSVGTQTANNTGLGALYTIDDAVTGSTVTLYTDIDTAGNSLTFDLKTDGSADALTVAIVATDTGTVGGAAAAITALVADDIETLTIATAKLSSAIPSDDTFSIPTITLGDTTKIIVSGAEALQIGATASTAANLTEVAASTATGDLDFGVAGGTVFATANTGATFVTGSGDDVISLDVGVAGVLKAIDMGSNADVTVGDGTVGDMLSLTSAAGTGLTIVDLSSTTDQISQLLGSGNSAAQIGIEHIDFSAMAAGTTQITGSDGINIIVGGAVVDTINGGKGADVITGGAGADIINGGDGADTFVYGATITDSNISTTTAAAAGFDTVTVAAGDFFDFNAAVTVWEAATAVSGVALGANGTAVIGQLNTAFGIADDGTANVEAMVISFTGGEQFLVIDTDTDQAITATDNVIRLIGTVTGCADGAAQAAGSVVIS